MRYLLDVCLSWERDPSSVALPQVFFHLLFFYPLSLFFSSINKASFSLLESKV